MKQHIKCLTDFNVEKQRVFLRLDLNVPFKDGQILNDARILATLPTIEYLLEKGAKLLVASHLGRPRLPQDKITHSLTPIAQYLAEKLGREVFLIEDVVGDAPVHLIASLKPHQILMLENLRFEPGECENSHHLASHFANYTDIYINDAFATCHRSHASMVALPEMLNHKGIGFLIQKELQLLDLLFQAKPPFVLLLGGAKVSDKIGMVQHLMDKVDILMVGGMMAYTFLKAEGINVGDCLIQTDQLQEVKALLQSLKARGKTYLLPIDHVICPSSKEPSSDVVQTTTDANISQGFSGYDIGPQTIQKYKSVIAKSQTLFWNGPMGLFEKSPFDRGTLDMAKAIQQTEILSLVGGGDTVAAVWKSGLTKHLLTGGGASLKYLQGQMLPGLKALTIDPNVTTP